MLKIIFFIFILFHNSHLSATEARGQITGHIALLQLPSLEVKKMIGSEFELLPQNITGPGCHPVIILFFNFSDVHPNFFQFEGILPNYSSAYIQVPFVSLKNSTNKKQTPFSMMPVGYMNNHLMVYISRKFSGLPKKFANIISTSQDFSVIQNENIILRASFFNVAKDPDTMLLKTIQDLLSQPVVSDRPIGSKIFGASRANLKWDGAKTNLSEIDLTMDNLFKFQGEGIGVKAAFAVGPWQKF